MHPKSKISTIKTNELENCFSELSLSRNPGIVEMVTGSNGLWRYPIKYTNKIYANNFEVKYWFEYTTLSLFRASRKIKPQKLQLLLYLLFNLFQCFEYLMILKINCLNRTFELLLWMTRRHILIFLTYNQKTVVNRPF